jgi:hypothetical protein
MSVITSEGRALRASSAASASWLGSPLFFWGVLALYLAAHVLLRLWETPNLGKNDVQEALAAQGWAWGYHPRNPPLHTWLLMGSYSLFGVGLFAHVILKYALLGATYTFAYLSGRRLLSTPQLALMATLSVSSLTPFAWTVHTALTHTLLLATIIFATTWAAVRLTTYRRVLDYAVLGVVIGLGLLAKYSYPLFLLPLLAAMLCQAEFRRVVLHPAFLITLAIAGALFAPHGAWMATTRFDFVEFLTEKQRGETIHPYLIDALGGVANVAKGALSFLGALLLLWAIFLRQGPRSEAVQCSPWARAVPLALCLALGLLVLDAIVLRATQFEERYFICALLLAPLALFVWLDTHTPAISDRRQGLFGVGLVTAALIVLAGLSGRALYYNQSCDRCLEEMPVAEFAHRIHSDAGFTHGTIIADHYDLAGNMRVAFPHSRAIAANYLVAHPAHESSGQCLVVWNARRGGESAPSSLRSEVLRRGLALPAGVPNFVDAPLRRSAGRMDRFAYWVLPNADGNCSPR